MRSAAAAFAWEFRQRLRWGLIAMAVYLVVLATVQFLILGPRSHLDGDAYTQMTAAIATVAAALGEAGAELRHVVRTVVYVLDMADVDQIARA